MPSRPFNDAMVSGQGWQSYGTQVWGAIPGALPQYTVRYAGGAPTILDGGALTPVSAGVWTLKTNGEQLRLNVPDRSKLIEVLADPSKPRWAFTPHYIESKRPFKVIRPMDVLQANDADIEQGPLTWDNRPKVTDQFWSSDRGGPIEPWVDLCAELGAILYVNVPHTATKDWVEGVAALCASKRVRTRWAYSNETWNWATKAGGRSDGDGGVPKLAGAMPVDAFTLQRSIDLGDIARHHQPKEDVEVVFEIQGARGVEAARNAWERVKPAPGKVQFIAMAPYMRDATRSTNPADYVRAYNEKADRWFNGVGDTMGGMPGWVQLGRDTGTKIICYEANLEPTLGLKGEELAAQRRAQKDEGTYHAMRRYIQALRKHGIEELCVFVDYGPHTGNNTFEIDDDPTETDSAKRRAVFDEAAANQFDDGYSTGGTTTPTPPPPPTPVPVFSPPTGLKITEEPTRLKLTWDRIANVTYRVYRDGVKFTDSTDETAFTQGKTEGVYTVTAVKGTAESAHSSPVRWGTDPADAKRARRLEIARLLVVLAGVIADAETERVALREEDERLARELGE